MTVKPLLVSTFDLEGGAARAAHRLHCGLRGRGVSSQLLVQMKSGDTEGVIGPEGRRRRAWARLRPALDSAVLAVHPHRSESMVSPAWLPGGAARRISRIDHDLLNLHWTTAGFLSIRDVGKQEKPIVWTMHDMWVFTGGCHYAGDCQGYLRRCGRCPQLGSDRALDLSRLVWLRKSWSWGDRPPAIVSPTGWLAAAAKDSSLFGDAQISVIPNGVDIRQFQPLDRQLSRQALGLPEEKALVGFGALSIAEPRKGAAFLAEALDRIADRIDPTTVELVVFGASHPRDQASPRLSTRYMGRLNDDVSLALLYSAVDVVVVPSLYEAHSLVAIEAMACGTPCVAFRVEGLSEVVDHRQNGLLATPFDSGELADAVVEMVTNESFRGLAATQARAKAVKTWDIDLVAGKYQALYASVT